jgi:hypothetical protein
MSIAIPQIRIQTSETWRRFCWACVVVIGVIGVGCVLYAIESLLLDSRHRFVENPAETMMRAAGLAHFSIGWIFLFSSPRLRNRAALARLAVCTLFGAAFCAVFAWGGGDKNPLCAVAFYGFFFIHEIYDEAHLFKHCGELPRNVPNPDRFLGALAMSVSLTFIVLLASFQIMRGRLLGRSDPLQHPAGTWLYAVAFTSLIAAAWAWPRTLRRAIPFRDTVQAYQPLLAVYGGLLGILLVGTTFGSVGYNFIIILHGIMWLFFACGKMRERRLDGDWATWATWSIPWTWLRHTPAGLITLHIALAALVLLLFALRTHIWERTGLVCDLVSKTWFPYWAIMHIAMSFWRK